jgi:hypothetical protein
MPFETVCEVNEDIELLQTRVTAETSGFSGYCYFDDLQLLKNLTDEKITGNEQLFQPIREVTAGSIFEKPIYGAVIEAQIISAHIVPKSTIIGNDIDYMTLKLMNKETSEVICTKTFIIGTNAEAYKVTDFGPVDTEAGAMNLAKGVSLVKEETGTGMLLPESLLIVQWNLR